MSQHDPARRLLAPAWRVVVEAHYVERWHIERQVVKVCAHDEPAARLSATRAAQVVAEIPPVRSLGAITFRHTTATPLGLR